MFMPEEVSAMILQKMNEIAEAYLGQKITRAVISVPAHFNDAQQAAGPERAQRALSHQTLVPVHIASFHVCQDLSELLARATFEVLNADLFKKTYAKLATLQVHEIILKGGSSRIPKIVELLENFYDGISVISPNRGDIERFMREAKSFAEEDAKLKKKIDAKIGLDTYLYETKLQLSHDTQLDNKGKEEVLVAFKKAQDWLQSVPMDAMTKEEIEHCRAAPEASPIRIASGQVFGPMLDQGVTLLASLYDWRHPFHQYGVVLTGVAL
ncbi:hypothetical protein HDU86_007512 [Geranomyces michiganensis]|nr:hypothetical protein HDU86_007512 [Geranomyces michiganensis]